MTWGKRWVVAIVFGGTLLASLASCVVAPVAPGYVASPPVVILRPYRHHRHYHHHPYRGHRPYRPYNGWPYHPYRW